MIYRLDYFTKDRGFLSKQVQLKHLKTTTTIFIIFSKLDII